MSQTEAKERILPFRVTKSGWGIVTVHYSAIPGYDFEAACMGMTQEGIQQELEIDWHSSKGKRVYPEFGREHHVALEPLPFDPSRPLYCGWDWGMYAPAFVPTQMNALGQWLIFPSISPSESTALGVYEFGEIVADHLTREYALPNDMELKELKLVHFGDPQGAAPPPRTGDSPKEMRSCFDIIRKGLEINVGVDSDGIARTLMKPGFGWRIMPGKVGITERLEAVRARLTMTLQGGLPALVVDPNAYVIKEGFLGGYCYKQRHDGHYEHQPDKSIHSHALDALGYIATRLFSQIQRDTDDYDDDDEQQHGFRSHASGRHF